MKSRLARVVPCDPVEREKFWFGGGEGEWEREKEIEGESLER
jgi:hypothetical protein